MCLLVIISELFRIFFRDLSVVLGQRPLSVVQTRVYHRRVLIELLAPNQFRHVDRHRSVRRVRKVD